MFLKATLLLLSSMASLVVADPGDSMVQHTRVGPTNKRRLQEGPNSYSCYMGQRCLVRVGDNGEVEGPVTEIPEISAFADTSVSGGLISEIFPEGDETSIKVTLNFFVDQTVDELGEISFDINFFLPNGDPSGWSATWLVSQLVASGNPDTVAVALIELRCDKMGPGVFVRSGPYSFDPSNPALDDQSIGFINTFPPNPNPPCDFHDEHLTCLTLATGKQFEDPNSPGDFQPNEIIIDPNTGLITGVSGGAGFQLMIAATKVIPVSHGEPHFRTWGGEWFDYQGGCDLVLLSNADFLNGLGLDIHIRTIVRYDYSFIRSVAIQMGVDTIEVSSFGAYSINGVSDVPLPLSLASGHTIFHKQVSAKKHEFTIHTGNGNEAIFVSTMKDIVNVDIQNPSLNFVGSKGLMGTFDKGSMVGQKIGRDGKTVFEDPDEFGQEWQVNDSDPQLFRTQGDVVYPEQCKMPSITANGRRRLGESKVSKEDAEKACAHKSGHEKENCIFDVMATGDLDMVV